VDGASIERNGYDMKPGNVFCCMFVGADYTKPGKK